MAIQNDGGGRYNPAARNVGPKKSSSQPKRSLGTGVTGTGRAPVVHAPVYTSSAAPKQPSYSPGGGGGGGGGSFFGGGGVGAAAMPSDADWLAGDSGYQAQLAALLKALENTNSEFDRNLQNYETDYTKALGSLGWGDTDPLQEGDQLGWLMNDLNTSVGRGREAVTNDFSGRGALQSSHYARALDNLMRSLDEQRGSMVDGRQRFVDDIAAKRSAYGEENKAAQGSARAEALARRAMGYTSV